MYHKKHEFLVLPPFSAKHESGVTSFQQISGGHTFFPSRERSGLIIVLLSSCVEQEYFVVCVVRCVVLLLCLLCQFDLPGVAKMALCCFNCLR